MSEANVPFDSVNQPDSNQPEANSIESKTKSASSGRPKAFSELKALTDLTPAQAETNPALNQNDEIELDISKIFDASALDGLVFEAEANHEANHSEGVLPDLLGIDTEIDTEADLWAEAFPSLQTFEAETAPEAWAEAQGTEARETKARETEAWETTGLESQSAGEQTRSKDLKTVPAVEPGIAEHSLADHPAEVPSLASLIGLIQELNQCNGILMDRVSQLEEALETSQSALQAEVGRVQDTEIGQDWNNSQDWATVQDQVANLFNQLEFAHQTNQRQQILIETLTGQLENSQERVAQLEREAALIQQRYDEQAQFLAKSEHTNRDLQARLQRQQRYTLQFKVALERSLEVAAPSYETSLYEINPESKPVSFETTENPQFLPKAKQIQPWSAQTQLPLSQSTWMKLQSSLSSLAESTMAEEKFAAPNAEEPVLRREPKPEVQSEAAQPNQHQETTAPATAHLHLPAFGMPLLQFSDQVDPSTPEGQPTLPDPMLNQLNEVVKPLADMLAEAMLAGSAAAGPMNQPAPQIPPQIPPQIASQQDGAPEVHPAPEPNFSEPHSPEAQPDDLLSSVIADAEDALWQDLARLIDVSTEDVVKASLSGDLAAFESIDFAALNPTAQPHPYHEGPSTAALPTGEPDTAIAPLLHRQHQAGQSSPAATQAEEPIEQPSDIQAPDQSSDQSTLSPASWPSPVVYPLRPVKKRHSLAMVDLPTFPRN
ncbi:MAG: hypothetical protein ACKO7W_19735 [Elainella sp.]